MFLSILFSRQLIWRAHFVSFKATIGQAVPRKNWSLLSVLSHARETLLLKLLYCCQYISTAVRVTEKELNWRSSAQITFAVWNLLLKREPKTWNLIFETQFQSIKYRRLVALGYKAMWNFSSNHQNTLIISI